MSLPPSVGVVHVTHAAWARMLQAAQAELAEIVKDDLYPTDVLRVVLYEKLPALVRQARASSRSATAIGPAATGVADVLTQLDARKEAS